MIRSGLSLFAYSGLASILTLCVGCAANKPAKHQAAEPAAQTQTAPSPQPAAASQPKADPAKPQQTRTQAAPTTPSPKTNLKTDENVLVFPTNAIFNKTSNQWRLNIHGWVFEPEKGSLWRNGLIKSLALFIGVDKHSPDAARFKQRTRMFLVDNERNKTIVLKTPQQYFSSPKTGPNGHFEFNSLLNPGHGECSDWLNLTVQTRKGDQRAFSGAIQCLDNEGISVVSDIDDTIKDSHVLDKKELLRKTFLKEFEAVDGMAKIYQHWHSIGFRFHYVSSSPWQLYPVLSEFIDTQQFPRGSMHLKLVRVKDKTLFNLFAEPEQGKVPTITKLLNDFPGRKFILVGDSGERDAHIYADMARKYPDRIVKIYIRDVKDNRAAVENIFAGLPRKQWAVFTNSTEILNQHALLNPQ